MTEVKDQMPVDSEAAPFARTVTTLLTKDAARHALQRIENEYSRARFTSAQ